MNSSSMSKRILVTGQFWDRDFSNLINRINVPTTLIAADKLESLQSLETPFDVVLIAQNRRESISQKFVDHVRALTGEIPVVMLLGSLCEGHERSGRPLTGVTSVYWHQWTGSFDQLLHCVRLRGEVADPKTDLVSLEFLERGPVTIGVSALCETQWSMIDDALRGLGLTSTWLERALWNADQADDLAAICIDCDALSGSLDQRLELLAEQYGGTPRILLAGFPRQNEVQDWEKRFQILQVVSKPFSLAQLAYALTAATGMELVHEKALPNRFTKRSQPTVDLHPPRSVPTKG